jgi:hypothetical protein
MNSAREFRRKWRGEMSWQKHKHKQRANVMGRSIQFE